MDATLARVVTAIPLPRHLHRWRLSLLVEQGSSIFTFMFSSQASPPLSGLFPRPISTRCCGQKSSRMPCPKVCQSALSTQSKARIHKSCTTWHSYNTSTSACRYTKPRSAQQYWHRLATYARIYLITSVTWLNIRSHHEAQARASTSKNFKNTFK